jgi:hypothetical protein
VRYLWSAAWEAGPQPVSSSRPPEGHGHLYRYDQGVTKRCRLVYERKCGVGGGGGKLLGLTQPMSTTVHRRRIGDLTPYLSYGYDQRFFVC